MRLALAGQPADIKVLLGTKRPSQTSICTKSTSLLASDILSSISLGRLSNMAALISIIV
jgi:hypothetical protein